jgi:hypothetical protein
MKRLYQLVSFALLGGAFSLGVTHASPEGPTLQTVRAHADGSVSLAFSQALPTDCPVKNAVRIVPNNTSDTMVDLIYRAHTSGQTIRVRLAAGCTPTGQSVAESIEVLARVPLGRIVRDHL